MTVFRRRVFPALAGLLWAGFLLLDLTGLADSTEVKFAGICLCFLVSLTGLSAPEDILVSFALAFTVGADWFLLVRNDHYLWGVSLFIVVQLLYAFRLYLLRGKTPCKWGLILRLVLGFPLLPGPALGPNGRLYALTGLYFLNLCVNAAEAFALGSKARTFTWGLLLFICCDLCVGAYNLGLLTSFTWWGSWLFYLPSQVLIVLSQEQEITGDPYEKTV